MRRDSETCVDLDDAQTTRCAIALSTFLLTLGILAIGGCPPDVNVPPTVVAVALADSTRVSSIATLDASASSDPDDDALLFSWTQISGPAARLEAAEMPLARVLWDRRCADADATFRVTVSDGVNAPVTQDLGVTLTAWVPAFSIIAGPDTSATAGSGVTATSLLSNPLNEVVEVTWLQLSGPPVDLAPTADGLAVNFVAPDVAAETELLLEVRAMESLCGSVKSDQVRILIVPRPGPVSARWTNATDAVNADVNWLLPSQAWVDVTRTNFSLGGIESIFLSPELIADGLHWFPFNLWGQGRSADVQYTLDVLGYRFDTTQRLTADAYRAIALDVRDGQAKVIFNGWLGGSEDQSGGLTKRYPIECIAAWRGAEPEPVAVDLNVLLPSGAFLPVFRQNFNPQGVERIAVEPGVQIADGIYRVDFQLFGSGRSARIAFDAAVLGVEFSRRETMLADARRIMGIDVHQGVARTIFNGWHDAGSMLGELAPDRPLAVVAGFQALGEDVAIEANVIRPDGSLLPVDRSNFDQQQFESIGISAGTAISDGVYRFQVNLFGEGRTANVAYKARLLNWSVERREQRIVDSTNLIIDVRVQNGVATQIGSNW